MLGFLGVAHNRLGPVLGLCKSGARRAVFARVGVMHSILWVVVVGAGVGDGGAMLDLCC